VVRAGPKGKAKFRTTANKEGEEANPQVAQRFVNSERKTSTETEQSNQKKKEGRKEE